MGNLKFKGFCKKCNSIMIHNKSETLTPICTSCGFAGRGESPTVKSFDFQQVMYEINKLLENYFNEAKTQEALNNLKSSKSVLSKIFGYINESHSMHIVDYMEQNISTLLKYKPIMDLCLIKSLLPVWDKPGEPILTSQPVEITMIDLKNLEDLMSFYPSINIDTDPEYIRVMRNLVDKYEILKNSEKSVTKEFYDLEQKLNKKIPIMFYFNPYFGKHLSKVNVKMSDRELFEAFSIYDVSKLNDEIQKIIDNKEQSKNNMSW